MLSQTTSSGPIDSTCFDKELACFHCGLPVPLMANKEDLFSSTIQNEARVFCCAGCQAVAELIHQGGLDQFYRYRSELNQRPDSEKIDFTVYDNDAIQATFVRKSSSVSSQKTAYLLLDGITCAACVWLIEKYFLAIEGVNKISVNASTHQCVLIFDASLTSLSFLMEQLFNIGYRPQPYTQAEQQQQQSQQQRQLLLRLSLAGFGMMIVGMVAVALYAGAIQGIEAEWIQLFRWVSLLVATPIVLFSAQPFWAGAWRNLKLCNLTMDVPVSLAIVLAYLASAWATLTQSGEVYFDSITMFTFFLLLGRYFEARLRYRNQQMAGLVSQLLPVTVTKVNRSDQSHNIIALAELKEGETIRVASGETIPADGLIVDGSSAIVEALLTGEAEPVLKTVGDSVIAGTVNTEGTLLVDVVAVGDNTRLSTISQLVEEAELEKPKLQQLADKVASVFVAVVLVVALTVYISWRFIDPDVALWVTLSVLVVTCPCALSLATPTALTAALAMMRRQGLLVLKGHVIETLTAITKVIFDKTGTLTYGQPTVVKIEIVGEKDKSFNADKMNVDEEIINEEKIISISAALEKGSSHPIASAFTSRIKEIKNAPIIASHIEITTAAGVSGRVGNDTYRLGKPSFSLQYSKEKMLSKTGLDAASYDELDGELNESKEVPPRVGQWLLLSKNNEAFAWIELSDNLRASAKQVVNGLRASGIKMEILSGDRESTVKLLADELGIAFHAEQTPEKKLALLQRYQKNDTVMMVGDGINDVPVLAGADISIAMDSATDFARTRADSILLNNDLTTLSSIIALSHRTKKIIRQNIVWALGYNLLALPLAAMAYIPPYLAAIGMSASSLIVVLNALRLYNYQYKKTATNTSKQSPMRASSYKK